MWPRVSLPIPTQIGNSKHPTYSPTPINKGVFTDTKVIFMLLKITLLIFKLSSDLSIGAGLSASPDAVLVCRSEKEGVL
jgi:hypothetical protein